MPIDLKKIYLELNSLRHEAYDLNAHLARLEDYVAELRRGAELPDAAASEWDGAEWICPECGANNNNIVVQRNCWNCETPRPNRSGG